MDPRLIGAARMLGAGRGRIFTHVIFPSSVPYIFAGLQIALSVSWAAEVAAEIIYSQNRGGLDHHHGHEQRQHHPDHRGHDRDRRNRVSSLNPDARTGREALQMEQAGQVILRCEHLARSFESPAGGEYQVLGDVSFEVRENEFPGAVRPGPVQQDHPLEPAGGAGYPSPRHRGDGGQAGARARAQPGRGVSNHLAFPLAHRAGQCGVRPRLPGASRPSAAGAQYFIDLVGLTGF